MENMTKIKVQKNQVIAKQKDIVKNWYIVLEGTVILHNSYAKMSLGKDAIIGIAEYDRYLCDYVAGTDVELAVFEFDSPEDLKNVIQGKTSVRSILLLAALNQRQQLLKSYAGFQNLTRQFHSFVGNVYGEYVVFCVRQQLEGQIFNRIDSFKPLEMIHKAEDWEVNNSTSLMQGYLEEYVQLMQKDDSLCIGAIMEACYQSRRVLQGIVEMVEYLHYHQDILLSESEDDIFDLYFQLARRAQTKKLDTKPLTDNMDRIADVIKRLNIYDEKLVTSRMEAYHNYDFSASEEELAELKVPGSADGDGEKKDEDCLIHILSYAQMDADGIEEAQTMIQSYLALPDMLATDSDAYGLRRKLTQMFYEVYLKVFMRSVTERGELSRIIRMFLNFGLMDARMVGEENLHLLFDLSEHLELCRSEHVHTIYDWLKSVYNGENEPSKNEFDMDYPAYLAELYKNGEITKEEQRQNMTNQELKVQFEIQNMFTSGNRATYGKPSTFCPILSEQGLINSVDKMLVTAQKLEEALNKVRKIDYSAFYQEVQFSDPEHGINSEMIMKEVLPDMILMPNAGTRAMMWQETAGAKRDTSARFLFPVFTAVDINDMMTETIGRYRWEICRKIQGVYWNDVREKSLTAEYCDYLQFYRKNHELSAESKERIKSTLLRSRNNYREVFVKDYDNWVKYESKGSYRLNRIARDILIKYCPFAKSIRDELITNPIYQQALTRQELLNTKAVQRIEGLYIKYQKAGGAITKELQDNLDYYEL